MIRNILFIPILYLFIFCLYIVLALPLYAEEDITPVSVKAGIYIMSLHDFNTIQESYTVTFWSWFIHDLKDYKPYNSAEITNAKSQTLQSAFDIPTENKIWSQAKYEAVVKHSWDLRNFPFDKQELKLHIEDSEYDKSGVRYIPDIKNTKIDQNALSHHWKLLNIKIIEEDAIYDTTYGDPHLEGQSIYSRLAIAITLQRQGQELFIDMLVGIYMAFLLAMFSLVLPATLIPARFTLITASIFAAVGNKYIIDSHLPQTTAIKLVDKIQWVTFLAIILAAIMAIILSYHQDKRSEKKVLRLSFILLIVIIISYALGNIYWIYHAVKI